MANKEYITLDLSEIKPYPNNPRINADVVNDVIVSRRLNFTGKKDEIFCIRDGQKLTYDEVFN